MKRLPCAQKSGRLPRPSRWQSLVSICFAVERRLRSSSVRCRPGSRPLEESIQNRRSSCFSWPMWHTLADVIKRSKSCIGSPSSCLLKVFTPTMNLRFCWRCAEDVQMRRSSRSIRLSRSPARSRFCSTHARRSIWRPDAASRQFGIWKTRLSIHQPQLRISTLRRHT